MIVLAAALLLAPSTQPTQSTGPAPGSATEVETEATPVQVFNGEDLSGWKPLGDAVWTVIDGELLGEVGGGAQSFLATARPFGDFRFEVDVRTELPGNSGIQIRSHENKAGRLFGYQIEIDPSERAWSGGLYDEARRGWLQNLEGRDEARAAFQPGEWNRYAIECRGSWLRTWIDGVPITDYLDPLDAEGVIGLQVHSGNNTKVRFRGFELTDFGTQTWRGAGELEGWFAGEHPVLHRRDSIPEQVSLRWTWRPDQYALELHMGPHSIVTGGDVRVDGQVVGAEVKPQREFERHAAVCRLGGRLRLFLDGRLVFSDDAFDPTSGLSFGFADAPVKTASKPEVLFEQLVPARAK